MIRFFQMWLLKKSDYLAEWLAIKRLRAYRRVYRLPSLRESDLHEFRHGGVNEGEAFRLWFDAYSNQYRGSGLMKPNVIAGQAWFAALNFTKQSLEEVVQKPDD